MDRLWLLHSRGRVHAPPWTLQRPPRIDDQLKRFEVLVEIHFRAVGGPDELGQRTGLVEGDGLEARAGSRQIKPHVLAPDEALLQDAEFAFEEG